MKRLMTILMAFILAGVTAQAFAQSAPTLINYQGKLTDASGALPTADYTLEFNIYDAASGGNRVWGAQTIPNIPVVQGYFNVMLGPDDANNKAIEEAFTGGAQRYLEITAGGTVISPRQQILSVPYAVQAEKAANATNAGTADKVRAPFGNWESLGKGLAGFEFRQAPTDGFLFVLNVHGVTVGETIKTIDDKNITTRFVSDTDTYRVNTLIMPVKKGHYWRVTTRDGTDLSHAEFYWLSIGLKDDGSQ